MSVSYKVHADMIEDDILYICIELHMCMLYVNPYTRHANFVVTVINNKSMSTEAAKALTDFV